MNKRRAKKAQPPYRKYTYRSNLPDKNSSEDETNEHESYDDTVRPGVNNFATSHDASAASEYSPNAIWPRSHFQKTDVLQCAIENISGMYLDETSRPSHHSPGRGATSFPPEIFVHIFEILNSQGKLKPKFLRICRLFYHIALPIIYRKPILRGPNFFAFVDVMSKDKTLGHLIRELDLSYVIQSGKNAFVAKLLKRSSRNLESFVAPQTSFGLGPLIALRNCRNLKLLDLRLVSETLNLQELFKSLAGLEQLTHLSFPRSSVEAADISDISWPQELTFLRLSGGVSNDFLRCTEFPETISSLEFSHCPAISDVGFELMLQKYGRNLKSLKVQYPMPGLKESSLDSCFNLCPNLQNLEITVDYVSRDFFDESNLPFSVYERPLRSLVITASGMLGTTNKLEPIDLALALLEDRLPRLRNVQCTAKLGWNPKSDYVSYIVTALEERNGGLYLGY